MRTLKNDIFHMYDRGCIQAAQQFRSRRTKLHIEEPQSLGQMTGLFGRRGRQMDKRQTIPSTFDYSTRTN